MCLQHQGRHRRFPRGWKTVPTRPYDHQARRFAGIKKGKYPPPEDESTASTRNLSQMKLSIRAAQK